MQGGHYIARADKILEALHEAFRDRIYRDMQ